MGAELLENSALAREVIENLESRLSRLPENDRPPWSLKDEIAKDTETTRIQEAELSQPLCVAIQIVLLGILRTAGIEFDAVVGHSSGEIAAAYAAGFISAEDAICLAYYRGLYSRLSCGPQGQKGAMLAVGTSYDDLTDICESEDFKDRVSIAAHNSSSSFTVSGDEDAIEEIKTILDDEKKFSRRLKVDRAYHSRHMNQCANKYLISMQQVGIQVRHPDKRIWFSSVYDDDKAIHDGIQFEGSYWNANMVLPVLFMQAVERASNTIGRPDVVIEIGPHPALKGPVLQTLQEQYGVEIPYTGLLQRGASDLESVADALGYTRVHLGPSSVNVQAYERYALENIRAHLATDLPTYCWDHDTEYWHESRFAKAIRSRKDEAHELLGHVTPDSTHQEMRWRNILRLNEIPWVEGHQIQNQIVFPAAGYVVLAIEASRKLVEGPYLRVIEIQNLSIEQALVLEGDSEIETLFSLSHIHNANGNSIESDFKYYAATGARSSQLQIVASGTIHIGLGEPETTTLHPRGLPQSNLTEVNTDEFYDSLLRIGYGYSDHFRALSNLERKSGTATGFIRPLVGSKMLIHPTLLDIAFQTVLLTHSAPYDGRIRGMHVPRVIRRIVLNPSLCSHTLSTTSLVEFVSTHSGHDVSALTGDVDIYSAASRHAMIQVEGLECVPFSPGNSDEDVELFSSIFWDIGSPNAQLNYQSGATQEQHDFIHLLERLAVYYLRKLDSSIPDDHPSRNESDLRGIFGFVSHIESLVREGHFPFWKYEWNNDSLEAIFDSAESHRDKIDFILLNEIGGNLEQIVKGNVSALEIGMRDGSLARFYEGGLGMAECSKQLAKVIKQITHRFPRMNIIEVGAGTGSATKSVFEEIGTTFSSYTYTDVSSGFFDQAQSLFDSYSSRVLYKVLDISKSPQTQGFPDHSYDVVIASMVLHATPLLEETLRNVRRLLRPGGYLAAIEMISNDVARSGAIFGAFPGWWLGAKDGRLLGPGASPTEWDRLLRSCGFSGCDSIASAVGEFSAVWVSQAVDNRVTFLRDPLIPVPATSTWGDSGLNDLVIIGGMRLVTSKLVVQLQKLLGPFSTGNVRHVVTFDGISPSMLTPHTTVLCLTELDEPLFQNLTDMELETMKKILHVVRSVLWVTQSRRAKSPFANMTAGLVRCAIHEIPELSFQLLDFEGGGQIQAGVIAESLLRFTAQVFWQNQKTADTDLLMTVEPELVIAADGEVLIPRLMPDLVINARYNSFYRPVMSQRNLEECHVGIQTTEAGDMFLFEKTSVEPTSATLLATHSFLTSVNIPKVGFAFLSLCRGQADEATMVCLSTERGRNIIPLACTAVEDDLPTDSGAPFLLLVAAKLMVIGSLSCLTQGDVLLVHNAHASFGAICKRELGARGIRTILTTDERHNFNPEWIHLNRYAPSRIIQDCIPRHISVLLDCSTPGERSSVVANLRAHITGTCKEMKIGDLMHDYAEIHSGPNENTMLDDVKVAVAEALEEIKIGKCPMPTVQTLRPSDLNSLNWTDGPTAIIDWGCDSSVPIRIQPIDSQPLFSEYKTYWLAGLSGGLGLSLCEWMITRGARYIVISSRKPKVDPSWLRKMEVRGATIRIFAKYDLSH
jgi:hybrid polyketide synthase/nonribosomal peptide synthetase ACE1